MPDILIGEKLGDYVIRVLLGRGGMARVYLGYDEQLARPAALKVIDSDIGPEFRPEYYRRFQNEARAIARLEHPNIVKVYQFGQYKDVLYMAMAFVEGRDLKQILRELHGRKEHMPYQQVVRITEQIGTALDYAHGRGVIHRDVKPSNIMLNAEGRAILTDFGLALSAGDNTQGETFGSAHYIAPEQALSSANAVGQSDLYSLGVCIYEMLTGHVPFEEGSAMTVALAHVHQIPPALVLHNTTLPPGVQPVIDKVLHKIPTRRYETGAELALALGQALSIQPGSDSYLFRPSASSSALRAPSYTPPMMIPPPPARERERYFQGGVRRRSAGSGQRRRLLVGAMVVVVVILAGFLLGIRAAALNPVITTTATLPPTVVAIAPTSALTDAATNAPTNAPTRIPTSAFVVVAATDEPDLRTAAATPTATELFTPSATTIAIESGTREATSGSTVTPSLTVIPSLAATQPATASGPAPNVQLSWDVVQFNVLNVGARPVSVRLLSFVQATKPETRQFAAVQWVRTLATGTNDVPLRPGGCFQVARYGLLLPTPFARCAALAAFWQPGVSGQFWLPTDARPDATFDVVLDRQTIASCMIATGNCTFALPETS